MSRLIALPTHRTSIAALSLVLLLSTAAAADSGPASGPTSAPASQPAASQPTAIGTTRPPAAAQERLDTQTKNAKQKPSLLETLWAKTVLGTTWYLAYSHGEAKDQRFNRFSVNRGYLTVKFKYLEWFQPRITLDTHQDDEGDWVVRLKYIYAKFILPVETALITRPNLELGLVHTPWFDYEEHINPYRMEGTMFIERNGVMNSADAGITLGGLLGRKLPAWYLEQVDDEYPGQWGSFALGIYNGGGYHAAETNNDKVFQARISLRPLGLMLPNLQLSYFALLGKGNTDKTPDWRVHDVMLSFQQRHFTVTGQFAAGQGNQKGTAVDASGESLDFIGGAGFVELKAPGWRSSVIGRYDYFDRDGEPATGRVIAGYAFHFLKQNFVLVSVDHLSYLDQHRPAD